MQYMDVQFGMIYLILKKNAFVKNSIAKIGNYMKKHWVPFSLGADARTIFTCGLLMFSPSYNKR